MAAAAMSESWYLDRLFPVLARVPTTLPWHLAGFVGDLPPAEQDARRRWLEQCFASVFPQAAPALHANWARAHLRMLAQEKLDAMAFHRIGRPGGPAVELVGADHARALRARRQGFILVLNHFDRLLVGPVILGLQGISTNALTMPIMGNQELTDVQRRFLSRKIGDYAKATHGTWRTTDEGLRPVYESLCRGGAWVILADAWRPEFTRMRTHAFLGGTLSLPTGIERMARSTGVPLLHATTHTLAPGRLRVVLETLPDNPRDAIDETIRRLERDVRERPWAWWHWGLLDRMWKPGHSDPGGQGGEH